jgi:type III secretion protein L
MSRLIKSEVSIQHGRVRGLPRGASFEPPPPVHTAAELELAAARLAVEGFAADLAVHQAEIDRLRRRVLEAYDEGETAGHARGLREADQTAERRLTVLASGVEQAVQVFHAEVAALERLAPLLAKRGLEKILGNPANYADLLAASLHHHLREIETAAIVRIEVSTRDFPNAHGVAELGSKSGCPETEVLAIEQLPAGACRVSLRLGGLDIGVDTQWSRLGDLLDRASRPAPPA